MQAVSAGRSTGRLRVLRMASVFRVPNDSLQEAGGRFDPMGGMQIHVSQLTAALAERLHALYLEVLAEHRPTYAPAPVPVAMP